MSFSNEHPSVPVVMDTSQSLLEENTNEMRNEWERAETGAYTTGCRAEENSREDGKLAMGSAEPFYEQHVGDMIESARTSAERQGF